MPAIVALESQLRESGLKVVGVNIREGDGAAGDFIDEFGMRFDVPTDRSGEVSDAYIRTGPPHTFFIGPDGEIWETFVGGAQGRRSRSRFSA